MSIGVMLPPELRRLSPELPRLSLELAGLLFVFPPPPPLLAWSEPGRADGGRSLIPRSRDLPRSSEGCPGWLLGLLVPEELPRLSLELAGLLFVFPPPPLLAVSEHRRST